MCHRHRAGIVTRGLYIGRVAAVELRERRARAAGGSRCSTPAIRIPRFEKALASCDLLNQVHDNVDAITMPT
jgi:hypothetical protein